MIIGIDLDGVLFDLVTNCQEAFFQHGYIDIDQKAMELDTYDFWHQWGVSTEDFWETFAKLVVTGDIFWDPKYLHGDPVDTLLALAEIGDLYLVSARVVPGCVLEAKSATQHWLYQTLGAVPWSGVLINNDKTVIKADVFFEDSEDNMLALLDAGTLPVCIDRPWNQGWEGDRIASFDDAITYITETLIRQAEPILSEPLD